MAIDTAAKRKAVAGVSRTWRAPGVTPDATPDAFWRQTVGRGWGGIAAGAPASTGWGDTYATSSRYRLGHRYGWMTGLIVFVRG